jgi:diguanylate cyclase (GGDEF)-like protein
MRVFGRLSHPRDMPAEIYVSLVSSLFSDPRTLLVGSIGTVTAALVTGVKADEPLLFLCALGMVIVSIARALDMRAFAKAASRPLTAEAARGWELRYVIGASAYVAILGAWCLVAFGTSSDPLVHLLSFSMTLVNLIGVAGRNFGSKLLVIAQLICSGVPLTMALFLRGDAYYVITACVLLPFFVSFKAISDRLRQTLLHAAISGRDVRLLASRFDTALNNMAHGLCMLDAQRRLVIANERLPEILGVPAKLFQPGVPVRLLLRDCVKAGMVPKDGIRHLVAEALLRLSGANHTPLVVELENDRTLTLTFRGMDNGGSVILVEDITERKNTEEQINRLTRYDALTALPNRAFFREKMEQAFKALPRTGQCAILFLDLDQFKQVNDTLGHPCGDELLRIVADRLRQIVRETDVIARLGGDEFVVLQSPSRSPEEAVSLARRIVEELGRPYSVEGHDVVIGASIGIAVAPHDGTDPDLLLKNADMALYRAKSDGRGAWRFFEPDMDLKAKARRRLELDLRNALSDDAFQLHYQPLVSLKTGQIVSCEALLRWPHPERGMISPAEFIPVAEEIGLIVEIGKWVLIKACTEAIQWPAHVNVAVNLSAIQFRRDNVVETVRGALEATGLPPSRLELEITESVLMQDTEATRAVLQELRELGVRISLDDFGTGYSSLSYLHSFPLNKVKIDRSFLLGIEESEKSRTLLHGVARLSAELGMSVVIEGVETEEQLDLIGLDPHIDEAQGFLFSKPLPASTVLQLLFTVLPRLRKVA